MSRPHVTVEVAQVYRAGDRRYLSKHAAYVAAARTMIKKKCDCEYYDFETGAPATFCRFHSEWEWGQLSDHGKQVIKRLVRRMKREVQS